jgi:cytochrome oxidase assembly protein ShyY1
LVCSSCLAPQRPQFLSDYDPIAAGSFVYLDLPLMAQIAGIIPTAAPGVTAAPPVLLDALEVNRNENRNMKRRNMSEYIVFTTTPMIHTVYAATWFTLSIALVALTYIRFKKKLPIRQPPRVSK